MLELDPAEILDTELPAYNIKTFGDARGFFREVARNDREFFKEGIQNVRCVYLASGKSANAHLKAGETGWLYVPAGRVKFEIPGKYSNSESYVKLIGQGEVATVYRLPAESACRVTALDKSTVILITGSGEK
jgi:dTDP-4-dehydrorhamnose 3,5-epimerase-like enzyme